MAKRKKTDPLGPMPDHKVESTVCGWCLCHDCDNCLTEGHVPMNNTTYLCTCTHEEEE